MSNYQDIIHLERPVSKKKKMSLTQRAAQFSPFAALVGHDSAIKETARFTEDKIELDEQKINQLNEKLIYLNKHLPCEIKITYFVPDQLKNGGSYHTIKSILLKIDEIDHLLILENKTKINIYDIIDININ